MSRETQVPGGDAVDPSGPEPSPEAKRGPERHGPPSRRARLVLFIVGIALALIAVVFVVGLRLEHGHARDRERARREDELAKGPEVPIAVVRPAPRTRKITLAGDVRALRLAVVYARVSGYLSELDVDRGDKVVRDQVLGRITTPETEQQLRPLVASLATRRAIADRLRPLVAKGVVSQQDLDRADADVMSAQSDVERLRALERFDQIRAPFDGTVTKRYVDVGALMPAPTGSTESAQPLVDVADTSRVRVVVYVGQRDATGVKLGDKLSIQRDDDPTHPIEGAVTRTPLDLDPRTRTMWVEAELPNPDGRLYPGQFVTVTLEVPAPPGVVVPSASVSIVSGNPAVARIDGDKVKFVPIQIADDDGKLARIVAGLAAGDRIANRISDELADGAKVRPITAEELAKKRQQEDAKNAEKHGGAHDGSGVQDGSGPNAGRRAGSASAYPGTGSSASGSGSSAPVREGR